MALLTFEERIGSLYCVEGNNIVYEVTEPAVLFDKELFVLQKIGNKEDVMNYFEHAIEKCKKHNSNLYESWVVMDLPKDAEIMDKLLNNTGFLERFLQENHISF